MSKKPTTAQINEFVRRGDLLRAIQYTKRWLLLPDSVEPLSITDPDLERKLITFWLSQGRDISLTQAERAATIIIETARSKRFGVPFDGRVTRD